MAKAKGVDESFNQGVRIGSSVISDIFDSRKQKRQKERERLDQLVSQNPDLMSPLDYQRALGEIDKSGTFSLGETSDEDLSERRFGKREKSDLVVVDALLASAYPELKPFIGQVVNKTNLFEGNKVSRAKIIAGGQKERQEDAQTHQTGMEDFKARQREIVNFQNQMSRIIADPESTEEQISFATEAQNYVIETAELPEITAEQNPVLFGLIKPGSKFNFSDKVPKVKQKGVVKETSVRKQNPQTKKWWVFKDGKWQPE